MFWINEIISNAASVVKDDGDDDKHVKPSAGLQSECIIDNTNECDNQNESATLSTPDNVLKTDTEKDDSCTLNPSNENTTTAKQLAPQSEMIQCKSCSTALSKGDQWYTCTNCPLEHFSDFCLDCYTDDVHPQHED